MNDAISVTDAGAAPGGCTVTAVGFDFAQKAERALRPDQLAAAMAEGLYVWVDVDFRDTDSGRAALRTLALVNEQVIEDATTGEPATQQSRYPDCLHMVMSGCRMDARGFELQRVDAVVGRRFLLTIHRGPAVFLEKMRRECPDDFRQHAQTPSFLIYELWDHLLSNYIDTQRDLEREVEKLQAELMRNVDDAVFQRVGDISSVLLHFRSVLLPARQVLSELSTRRSEFVSEQTQPFLANMVGTVERVLQDLLADREVLSETLNLHMSMVAHRTNDVVKRLTIVSVIFMPLTFLCGIWGMNFEHMPELGWKYGYLIFWSLAVAIVGGVVIFLQKKKWL